MSEFYKFGLIGQNVAYSKSADIFKAIFELKGLDGSFENFDLDSENEFDKKFKSLMTKKICGLSVTIPHKKRVIPLLNDISAVAEALEAVNSISVENGLLHGHNTDVFGFSLPLRTFTEKLKHGRAMILGCGGSARAVVYSLYIDYEISEFNVIGRSIDKLQQFKTSMKEILRNSNIETSSITDCADALSKDFSIVVNCTPLGGWNHRDNLPFPENFNWDNIRIYYDLNYNQGNLAISQALDKNVIAFDGSQMLVGQAVRSFDIWTGQTVEIDAVYSKVFGRAKQSV
ncbi:MAG: shikimate dehydrogenase [candidate division Zixibacteria bacterium]|nr:shikimate dehydrogenase [candidate division Zixibacteria bacterium]